MVELAFILGLLVSAAAFTIFFLYWNRKQSRTVAQVSEEQKDKEDNTPASQPDTPINTRQLVLNTLHELNCQTTEFGDNFIRFEYQGGTFIINATSDNLFINIIYPNWYSINLEDIDKMAAMQRLTNRANNSFHTTIFYEIEKDDNEANISSKVVMLFPPEINYHKDYLQANFHYLFSDARHLIISLEKEDKEG